LLLTIYKRGWQFVNRCAVAADAIEILVAAFGVNTVRPKTRSEQSGVLAKYAFFAVTRPSLAACVGAAAFSYTYISSAEDELSYRGVGAAQFNTGHAELAHAVRANNSATT
jgi:hypothetical protein